MLRQGPSGGHARIMAAHRRPGHSGRIRRGGRAAFRIIARIRERHNVATQSLSAANAVTAQPLRLGATCAAGLGLAGVLWLAFSGPLPLSEFCTRNRPTWVFGLFDTAALHGGHGAGLPGRDGGADGAVPGALWLAPRVGGRPDRRLAAGRRADRSSLCVLLPGYPLLSNDIFKYVFDGRIMAVYGENPFLRVPADYPDDRFYDLVYWKAVVNAHGPIWRVLEAASAQVGGERCVTAILAMKVWPVAAYLATIGVLFVVLRTAVSGPGARRERWRTPGVLWCCWKRCRTATTTSWRRCRCCWRSGQLGRSAGGWRRCWWRSGSWSSRWRRWPARSCWSRRGGPGRQLAGRSSVGGVPGGAAGRGGVRAVLRRAQHVPGARTGQHLLGLAGRAGGDRAGGGGVAARPGDGRGAGAGSRRRSSGWRWWRSGALWRGRLALAGTLAVVLLAYLLVGSQWFNPWYLLWLVPLALVVARTASFGSWRWRSRCWRR